MEPVERPWVLVGCLVGYMLILAFAWIQASGNPNLWQSDTAAITAYRA